ncbi:hypothetical protein SPLC1_S011330 [Arthrospira platensis C1]|nr:hypothetical protein SPLC1_S011330 [Arthrospira platensis C1]
MLCLNYPPQAIAYLATVNCNIKKKLNLKIPPPKKVDYCSRFW